MWGWAQCAKLSHISAKIWGCDWLVRASGGWPGEGCLSTKPVSKNDQAKVGNAAKASEGVFKHKYVFSTAFTRLLRLCIYIYIYYLEIIGIWVDNNRAEGKKTYRRNFSRRLPSCRRVGRASTSHANVPRQMGSRGVHRYRVSRTIGYKLTKVGIPLTRTMLQQRRDLLGVVFSL